MTQTQNFTILSNGLVRGGWASYTADTETGAITYSAGVKVGVGFFTKTVQNSGTYHACPSWLASDRYKPGTTVTAGPASFNVQKVDGGRATVSISVTGQDSVSGTGVLDVSQATAKIMSISAHANVGPMNAQIDLIPAAQLSRLGLFNLLSRFFQPC